MNKRLLAALTESERTAFMMYQTGESLRSVGRRLGVSRKTAKTLVARAESIAAALDDLMRSTTLEKVIAALPEQARTIDALWHRRIDDDLAIKQATERMRYHMRRVESPDLRALDRWLRTVRPRGRRAAGNTLC